ncbi:MAG: hypothetical protein SGILL_007287 [Bacillariaceae sp.]
MEYTLESIDPRLFNFVSSVVSVIIEAILTLSIGICYGILINWYLSKGFQLPAAMFGDLPKNTFQAMFRFLRNAQLTLPVITIIFLYAAADFSKSFADLGLYFVTIEQEGKVAPVLSLYEETRNLENRLLQTAGDPLSFRTFVLPKKFYDLLEETSGSILRKEAVVLDPIAHTLEETALTDSFLSAIEAIAVGDSPLAMSTGSLEVNRTQKGFFGIDAWVTSRADGMPLSSIPLLIPLNCSDTDMVTIEQVQGFDSNVPGVSDIRIQHSALVPNCTFTELRSSGVYIGEQDDEEDAQESKINLDNSAHILEYSYTVEPAYSSTNQDYGLLQDGQVMKVIQLSADDRNLARDRQPSWLQGRSIGEIDGIQFGDVRLDLAATFIASGPPLWIDSDTIRDELSEVKQHYSYLLVGALEGKCPSLLSGDDHSDSELSCMVFVELECDQFVEDIEEWKGSLTRAEDPTCQVGNMGMVWGKNFVADAQLASVVAGVFGRVGPHPFSYKHRAFMRNAIPAAMFALGTLDEMLSVESVVRAQVNGVYIFFMIFPLLLAIGLCTTFCVRRDGGKDVPRNPYHMMMLGKHCHDNVDIPDRSDGDFPVNINRRLVLKRRFNTDGTEEDVLEIGHDFHRPVEDRFFRYIIRSRLRGRSQEDKDAWYRKKIYQGYELDIGESQAKPSIRDVHDKILFGLAEKKLDERLEFLEPKERLVWFGLDKIPQAPSDQESPSEPEPASFQKKNIDKTSAHSKKTESSSTHAIDDSLRSNDHDSGKVACTKERKKIRPDKAYCVVCLHKSACTVNSGDVCKQVKKGCPGCQVIVCKDHWDEFDHDPSNWSF